MRLIIFIGLLGDERIVFFLVKAWNALAEVSVDLDLLVRIIVTLIHEAEGGVLLVLAVLARRRHGVFDVGGAIVEKDARGLCKCGDGPRLILLAGGFGGSRENATQRIPGASEKWVGIVVGSQELIIKHDPVRALLDSGALLR